MEWTQCLKHAIEYTEEHLLDEVVVAEIAKEVGISPFYFQKGFKVMTGVTISEYIRNRRLYLAALDIISGKMKMIDLAFKYGYDTPESFSRAFSRFHGVSPSQMKGDSKKIRPYLPLKITISILGGDSMDFKIETMKAFQVVGFKRRFLFDSAYENIPLFWKEFMKSCNQGSDKMRNLIEQCSIGEFGVCISDETDSTGFDYMIAGAVSKELNPNDLPDGIEIYEIPEMDWAKFRCVGPLPGALQTVNTTIFQEWLPGNHEFEIACGMNIEWYSKGDGSAQNYESGIWVPIKRK